MDHERQQQQSSPVLPTSTKQPVSPQEKQQIGPTASAATTASTHDRLALWVNAREAAQNLISLNGTVQATKDRIAQFTEALKKGDTVDRDTIERQMQTLNTDLLINLQRLDAETLKVMNGLRCLTGMDEWSRETHLPMIADLRLNKEETEVVRLLVQGRSDQIKASGLSFSPAPVSKMPLDLDVYYDPVIERGIDMKRDRTYVPLKAQVEKLVAAARLGTAIYTGPNKTSMLQLVGAALRDQIMNEPGDASPCIFNLGRIEKGMSFKDIMRRATGKEYATTEAFLKDMQGTRTFLLATHFDALQQMAETDAEIKALIEAITNKGIKPRVSIFATASDVNLPTIRSLNKIDLPKVTPSEVAAYFSIIDRNSQHMFHRDIANIAGEDKTKLAELTLKHTKGEPRRMRAFLETLSGFLESSLARPASIADAAATWRKTEEFKRSYKAECSELLNRRREEPLTQSEIYVLQSIAYPIKQELTFPPHEIDQAAVDYARKRLLQRTLLRVDQVTGQLRLKKSSADSVMSRLEGLPRAAPPTKGLDQQGPADPAQKDMWASDTQSLEGQQPAPPVMYTELPVGQQAAQIPVTVDVEISPLLLPPAAMNSDAASKSQSFAAAPKSVPAQQITTGLAPVVQSKSIPNLQQPAVTVPRTTAATVTTSQAKALPQQQPKDAPIPAPGSQPAILQRTRPTELPPRIDPSKPDAIVPPVARPDPLQQRSATGPIEPRRTVFFPPNSTSGNPPPPPPQQQPVLQRPATITTTTSVAPKQKQEVAKTTTTTTTAAAAAPKQKQQEERAAAGLNGPSAKDARVAVAKTQDPAVEPASGRGFRGWFWPKKVESQDSRHKLHLERNTKVLKTQMEPKSYGLGTKKQHRDAEYEYHKLRAKGFEPVSDELVNKVYHVQRDPGFTLPFLMPKDEIPAAQRQLDKINSYMAANPHRLDEDQSYDLSKVPKVEQTAIFPEKKKKSIADVVAPVSVSVAAKPKPKTEVKAKDPEADKKQKTAATATAIPTVVGVPDLGSIPHGNEMQRFLNSYVNNQRPGGPSSQQAVTA